MTQSEINNLKVGDIVTMTNPRGTFTVVSRKVSKGGEKVMGHLGEGVSVGGIHSIDLFHTPASLVLHPLPLAIKAMGAKIKCHARLTLVKGQWVYGSHRPRKGQDFGDYRLAA